MGKFKFTHPTEKMLIFIIVMLIGALVAILWFYGDRLNILWQQSGNSVSSQNINNAPVSGEVSLLIQSAEKNLYRFQPVADASQNRVYLPEAHIYLPMTQLSRQLVYFYSAATKDFSEQLQLSTAFTTNSVPLTFADVPCLQRFVSVGVGGQKNLSANTYVATKKLEDGRTLYIYKHDDGSCGGARWQINTPSQIASLFQQAHSY